MTIRAGTITAAAALCITLLFPVSGYAQAASPGRRGPAPAAIGALIGGTVALGATYAAARKYGNNERGEFCTRCFVQWSAITVPIGAVAGAALGWGIGRSRRSITVTPIVGRRAGGLAVFARF